MKKATIALTIILSFFLGNNIGFSQNNFGCDAELSVEKNRSVKSVGEKGVFFTLILKNTSNAKKNYTLTSSKSQQLCKKSSNDSKSTYNNSELNVLFMLPSNLNSTTSDLNVTINANSSQKFYVKIEAPEGIPYKTWSCLAINAKSDSCSATGAETILSVYVPNPSEG
ncbi:Fn3-like domain-containing protein [Hyunsoonleella pacifica]|uniref:C5a peptidase/Subtilisin-like protease SBT2-like Fn3-like domain-containing protein n=1 Tax=Hyunsoonleella pacifica TaxID=1080224 RepID=A0A4Q9FJA3_9FLAO|nr:Fn3-like domain-containing protein [Hyunsoonleella pacifica]TBN13199.1 hypothetical protein EYD46_17040 [Hyunsoonleella pacifica]GGD29006.1 hypothetical protein GCM10011368_33730 [Hyunsoonleella pacifica]